MSGKPWFPQDAELKRRWLAGDPVEEIAEALGRSNSAVRERAKALRLKGRPRPGHRNSGPRDVGGLPPERDQRAQRLCLKCEELFSSEHPGIRICPRCKPAVNAAAGGMDIARTGEAL